VDRALALPIESDVIDSGLYQDVLSARTRTTSPGFRRAKTDPTAAPCIAIDRDGFGSGPRDDREPETEEGEGYGDADAPGQFHIFSFATLARAANLARPNRSVNGQVDAYGECRHRR